MTTSTESNQQIQQLRTLIQDIDYAMLTTVDDDGSLHSYPMSINGEINSDATLWFFTYGSSHKVTEIKNHQQVNVNFASSDRQRFISISGTSQLVSDRNKMQEQWRPELQTWFPRGLAEPDIVLLKVNINGVDYWDSKSSFKPQQISLSKP